MDGIVRQDALGLDLVGVQAKRYDKDNTVQRPDIQAFVGALQGAQTTRGVFVTTGRFSSGALQFADNVAMRLRLIDGKELTRLMVRYNVGVQAREIFELNRSTRKPSTSKGNVTGLEAMRSMLHRAAGAVMAAAVAIPILVSPPSVQAQPVDTTAVVLRVVDGDTIDIRDDVRGRLRVRLLGIDTPETKKPGYTVGCWGPEATEFAESTMAGQRVALEPDPTQDRTDRYGRTLAYLVRATAGTTRSRLLAPERHTPTSTAAAR